MSYHITISEKTKPDLSNGEIEDAPPKLEDGGQVTVDELKEVNLGTSEDPRPTFVVKGQALANFIADHLDPSDWEFKDNLPDEEVFQIDILPPWAIYFDGAARHDGASAGLVFVTSQCKVLPYAFILSELCSNNIVEHQALIIGLQMATDMKILVLKVYGDSQLVIN
ncbi:uncharacterized protein LOC131148250 [Malania oleifera]|uniref:uncharacterized protein LOC131148250 n=1 Tax=Malania oleifera TaxID=397392 RepID=UPI0025AECA50|nr:uncharacterized protein LOC131148250 [Malania oleifera]